MRNPIILLLALALPLAFASCKSESYAKKRKAELAAWEEYKKDLHLNISTDSAFCFAQAVPWPDDLYYEICKGVYLRLTADDQAQRAPQYGNTVILRYKAYDLDDIFVTDNIASRDGLVFVYVPGSSDPFYGLNYACAYLHQGSKAVVIVDSKYGNATQQENVETFRYEITSTTITN